MKNILIFIFLILAAILGVFAVAGEVFAIDSNVIIKANNSDGPITVASGSDLTLSWSSYNVNSCYASGDWAGSKALFGSETVTNITTSKIYTITCSGPNGTVTDSVLVNVNSSSKPFVNLLINGNDNSITIPFNSYVTLNWNTTGAETCYAYGSWSGSKNLNGSEQVGPITETKTYTLVCNNSQGSTSDSVSVSVNSIPNNQNNYPYNPIIPPAIPYQQGLVVEKAGRNLSDGGNLWTKVVVADPGEILAFQILVSNRENSIIDNVVIKDELPSQIRYGGRVSINGIPSNYDIIQGVNIGSLRPGETREITFEAQVSNQFPVGQTKLINSVVALCNGVVIGRSDATLCINKASGSLGSMATYVSTGITDNVFVDSFAIPLGMALLILFVLKSKILSFSAWMDGRKEKLSEYSSEKTLRSKINKIRNKEFQTYYF